MSYPQEIGIITPDSRCDACLVLSGIKIGTSLSVADLTVGQPFLFSIDLSFRLEQFILSRCRQVLLLLSLHELLDKGLLLRRLDLPLR
jgi:hypothetical protein